MNSDLVYINHSCEPSLVSSLSVFVFFFVGVYVGEFRIFGKGFGDDGISRERFEMGFTTRVI